MDIEAIGVEVNHLGDWYPGGGNLQDLDKLMLENGYKVLGLAKIDKFYIKKKTTKKSKSQKEPKKAN